MDNLNTKENDESKPTDIMNRIDSYQDIDVYRNTFMRYMGKLQFLSSMHRLTLTLTLKPFCNRLQQWGGRSLSPDNTQIIGSRLLWHGCRICLHGYLWQGLARRKAWWIPAFDCYLCRRCVLLANAGLRHHTWSGCQSVSDAFAPITFVDSGSFKASLPPLDYCWRRHPALWPRHCRLPLVLQAYH